MNRGQLLLAAIASFGLLVVAVVLVVRPELLPESLQATLLTIIEALEALPGDLQTFVILILTAVFGLAAGIYLREESTGRLEPIRADTIDRSVSTVDDRYAADKGYPAQYRETLLLALRRQMGSGQDVSPEKIIEAGSWTDDQLAVATLSDQYPYPLSHQVLRWVDQEWARDRALNRTATEIAKQVDTATRQGEADR